MATITCPTCGQIISSLAALTRHQVFKHGLGKR